MSDIKIFFDTSVFICALENNSEKARSLFESAVLSTRLGISTVTIAEYCKDCYKNGRADMAEKFISFIKDLVFEIKELDEEAALIASKIYAEYSDVKFEEALQLASAKTAHANIFYSANEKLKQFKDDYLVVKII